MILGLDESLDRIKKADLPYLNDFLENFEDVITKESNFQDFKIKFIDAHENPRVDNPQVQRDLHEDKIIIHGEMGTGKTTFFDKIYHLFVDKDAPVSPIKKLTTDILIKLTNSEITEDLVFKTNSRDKITYITFNNIYYI
jgi:hypothetical protein